MLPKLSLALLMVYSSCATGPKVTVCVSDPNVDGFDCYDQRTQKSSFLKYSQSDKYIALPPTDAQTLFDYCKKNNP